MANIVEGIVGDRKLGTKRVVVEWKEEEKVDEAEGRILAPGARRLFRARTQVFFRPDTLMLVSKRAQDLSVRWVRIAEVDTPIGKYGPDIDLSAVPNRVLSLAETIVTEIENTSREHSIAVRPLYDGALACSDDASSLSDRRSMLPAFPIGRVLDGGETFTMPPSSQVAVVVKGGTNLLPAWGEWTMQGTLIVPWIAPWRCRIKGLRIESDANEDVDLVDLRVSNHSQLPNAMSWPVEAFERMRPIVTDVIEISQGVYFEFANLASVPRSIKISLDVDLLDRNGALLS